VGVVVVQHACTRFEHIATLRDLDALASQEIVPSFKIDPVAHLVVQPAFGTCL
jgi:hypothetical protein